MVREDPGARGRRLRVQPHRSIPDFIPVLGYLDDLVLVPLGVALFIRLTPPAVWEEARAAATRKAGEPEGRLGVAAAVAVVLIWLTLAVLVVSRLGIWN